MMDLVWRHATNRNYDVVNATHDNSDDDDTLHCDNYTPERRTLVLRITRSLNTAKPQIFSILTACGTPVGD